MKISHNKRFQQHEIVILGHMEDYPDNFQEQSNIVGDMQINLRNEMFPASHMR